MQTCSFHQPQTLRSYSDRDTELLNLFFRDFDAKYETLMDIPLFGSVVILCHVFGLIIYGYYDSLGCDPLRAKQIQNPNQLLPFFISDVVQVPTLSGLFVAMLFCGSLSSLAAAINALAAVTWQGFIEPHYGAGMSAEKQANITKILTFLYGAICVGIAFFFAQLPGHVLQVYRTVLGAVNGPLFGMFFLGALFPCANWIGALTGVSIGFCVTMTLAAGNYATNPYQAGKNVSVTNCSALNISDFDSLRGLKQDPDDVFPLFKISFLLYFSVGVVLVTVIGLVVSLCTGGNKDVDPELVVPVFDRFCCFLPQSWLKKLQCGVPYDKDDDDQKADGGVTLRGISDMKFDANRDSSDKAIQAWDGTGGEPGYKGSVNPAYEKDDSKTETSQL